jgi:UDP-N-acetylglucosamine 1-carboxyvinyltransferase
MENIAVEGGVPLRGEVRVSGAKNAALPILASSVLAHGQSTFRNVPRLRDIGTTAALLRFLGVEAEIDGTVVTIDTTGIFRQEAPYDLVKQMRASVLVLGPLLARFGRAKVSLPGGCAIGARPIDLHLKGLSAMGADIELDGGYVIASCKRLRGADVYLDTPTVTGTENLMMAACLARGRTTLTNAAREPEVEELARVLNKMGARVNGAGTDSIVIEGVDALSPLDHAILPDRIEAGTFLVAAAATGGDVLVRNCRVEHLDAVMAKLRLAGVSLTPEEDGVRVRATKGEVRAVDITTAPYPGFPTDMQAQLMVLLCTARGQSLITETIFENRFMHVGELRRMGADIDVRGQTALVTGVERLQAAEIMATDHRASASLVVAGLVAEGRTEVRRVYHIDRGYEDIVAKLAALGARIERVPGQV